MTKSTGTYILIAVLAIPIITLAVLVWLGSIFTRWYDYILPVFVVYFVALVANIFTRRACGKKVGGWRKMIGFLLLKTAIATFGIVGSICYAVSGGASLFTIHHPELTINEVYLVALIVTWLVMAILNEVMIK